MPPRQGAGPHRGVHRRREQQRLGVPVPGADDRGEEVVAEALFWLVWLFSLFVFLFVFLFVICQGFFSKRGRGGFSLFSSPPLLPPKKTPAKSPNSHVGKLGQAVGRGRRHDPDVGPPPQLDVQHGVADAPPRPPLVLVAAHRPRLERELVLGEEAAGGVGGDDADVAELGEEAGELFCVCFLWWGGQKGGREK